MSLKPRVPDFKELLRKVRETLFRREDAKLGSLVEMTGDEEMSHLLDTLPLKEKRRLFLALPPERRVRVLEHLSAYGSGVILAALPKDAVAVMIAAAESDDAVDIIQMLDDPMRSRVIADLRVADPRGLLPLLGFDAETAGGLMQTELAKFKPQAAIEEVRRSLAPGGGKPKKTQAVYVVDDNDALVGVVPLIHLISVPATATLQEVMTAPSVTVPATLRQAEVAQLFDDHNATELPVVGPRGRLLGRITADDIFEVMESEYAEDIARLTGVPEDDRITDPVFVTVRRRLPWLVVNLGTAVLASFVVGLFQATIAEVVILAAIMPIIAGMGGNAATQTLGVAVRAIALGELHHLNTRRAVARQVAAGTINGLVTGLIMAGLALAWTGKKDLAGVIAVAMTVNLFIAGLGGAAVPIILKRFKIDPALASSVFVTTMTDCCGFFVFLGLASVVL
ncbi:magnesium transporter [Candidatus Uhrbacteria bacterium]|nr:magnesium transporter [Candidatus Uhrbacteria bacterium]